MTLMAVSEDHPLPSSGDPLIGTAIGGRYVVHKRIARGGMGSVYQGVHVELGRTVAIKVLSQTYANDDEAVRRFQREARAASKIDHPNIVQILDLGRLDSGEPYLVMELLEGEDLADHIGNQGAMSPTEALEILKPVASALDAVHRDGLLHRDIKPANIFLAKRPDGEIVPKLLDFGLAALRETPEHDRLTREGIVVGTPHYVSPEAAEGENVDERTDVYSLGLVTFEMLTGVLPIDSQRPMSLLYAKVRRPAPTMSQRTGRSFAPALEQLIARTLSRTPSKRPAKAGELVSLLEAVIKDLPKDGSAGEIPREETAEQRLVKPEPKVSKPAKPEPRVTPRVRHSEPLEIPTERRMRLILMGAIVFALILGAWSIWYAVSSSSRTPEREPSVRRDDPPPEPAPVAAEPDLPIVEAPEPAPIEPIEPTEPIEPPLAAVEPPPLAPIARRPRPPAEQAPAPSPEVAPPRQEPVAALETDANRAASLTREAGTALISGQLPRARQLYRQATYADNGHAPAWRGLGVASERMGLAPEAASAYRQYLRLAPTAGDAAEVRRRLARLEDQAPEP
jgi:serine/threonine protein kinase